MTLDVDIAIGNLVISTITAFSALYIAYAALLHTAKPKIDIGLISAQPIPCSQDSIIIFEITNVGYWYACAPALNIFIYCNFDPRFELHELRYGSSQEISNKHVRVGKNGLKFIRAKRLKLVHKGETEQIHMYVKAPATAGLYRVIISAFSENGANFHQQFDLRCVA